VWLGDIPVASIRPGSPAALYYVHADHLNTPKMITRPADSAVMWRWDQDPFGTAAPNQNPAAQGIFVYNLRYPGQYYDSETGLSYNYFRDYDAQVGRYAESDPIGLKGGTNTYACGFDDPVNSADPTGLLTCTYAISGKQLVCTNNAGQGPCQDNATCTAQANQGPLPPGGYRIHEPGYSPNRPKWLYLQPSSSNQMYGRGEFFIHPWGISNGCIAIYFNSDFSKLSNWAVQDHGGSLSVSQ
jgi:RHS repeat-associated protein